MNKFSLNKVSSIEYMANMNTFEALSENRKVLFRARLNFILENTTPLSYMGPLVTYVIAIINLFVLYMTKDYEGKDYYYAVMIVINVGFLLFLCGRIDQRKLE